jgi:ATP-dependent DNA helicase RecG
MSYSTDQAMMYVKGVGPQKAELFAQELQIFTVGDFIQHLPFRYVDRSKFVKINQINPDDSYVQIAGKLIRLEKVGQGLRARLTGKIQDDTGVLDLVWFQGVRWLSGALKLGETYVAYGKPTIFRQEINISHPEMETWASFQQNKVSGVQPVYSVTEKMRAKKLDSKALAKISTEIFSQGVQIKENLPTSILKENALLNRSQSFQEMHFPTQRTTFFQARTRLKFEELFYVQLELLLNNQLRKKTFAGNIFDSVGTIFNDFYQNHLPFELTNAQKRVIKEIRNDLKTGKQMNRLVQGDVGSGKTIVALLSMLIAADNGFQSCLMAPTEILANQHFRGLSELLNNFPIGIALLTGSTKKSERNRIHEGILQGEIHILVGTHALIEDPVKFKNLGLAVIDEQHRFGVEQRSKLWKKAPIPPHILVMTATPIPRTLAMTLYGDLDVSVIDELPVGRKPIQTIHFTDQQRLRVMGFMKEQIHLGRQVYVVYPMIEESESLDLKYLMDGYEAMTRAFPRPEYQTAIVHGKMKPADKAFEMEQFVKGKCHIMVATTVIEVGVNVPNASVMVIENAERFGLSQLHQLRGRVGRGADQSFCILMTGDKLSQDGRTRIKTMVETTDGFKIAEVDLQLRGPGEMSGVRQSGVLDLKFANLATDGEIMTQSRMAATKLIEEQAMQPSSAYAFVIEELKRRNKGKRDFSAVS